VSAPLAIERLPANDPAADAELDAFFAGSPASVAQQTVGWRNVISAIGADEPMFLACRERAGGAIAGVLPAYRFAGPLGAVLNSCPQAGPLGGVACRAGADAEAVSTKLLEAFVALAVETRCATATVITNPFVPDRATCERAMAPDFVLENRCQALDLREDLDERDMPRAKSDNLRRNIRVATSGALIVDGEQTLESVGAWYEIHAERHRAIGAVPLPRAMFAAALEHMVPRGSARFFFIRRADDGAMVAGGFYVCHGAVVDALMPSMSGDAGDLAPNYLLALHSMRWARRGGFRWYNWQGSPPGSGVERFKRQWGSRDVPYAFLTKVTGDVEPFRRSTVAEVSSAYRWHFVLPYDRIGTTASADGPTSRAAAWRALQEAGP
jgi:CelD/BcsL family acetyltransferase involved in cellulose biosynthesis